MIGLLPTTTIFLATAPTDLRKAYDGLAVLVRQSLGQDPLSGSLYVFCNRRRDRIKILFWVRPAKRGTGANNRSPFSHRRIQLANSAFRDSVLSIHW